ncbi:MAG: DUF1287 domain-containing protein [Candidatus Humimicrobiaceae bacterium]
METKIRKTQSRKKVRYNLIIIVFIAFAALQIWTLKTYYREVKFELPKILFQSPAVLPISEITVGKETESVDLEAANAVSSTEESSQTSSTSVSSENEEGSTEAEGSNSSSGAFELSDIQKKIVLRLMKLPDEGISYKYQTYPETGYPDEKNWISTDVISVVLNDSGYDLMELLYKDMTEHIDAYPMDLKGSNSANKTNDFRVVYFQQKFFQRNGLELPIKFDALDPTNLLQWQPGDIVYFEIDPENPGKDFGGMISNRKSDKGIPLVIMITADLGKIAEVDALSTMKVSGHFRYPYPELNK